MGAMPWPCSEVGRAARIFSPKDFVTLALQTAGGYARCSCLVLGENLLRGTFLLATSDTAWFGEACDGSGPPELRGRIKRSARAIDAKYGKGQHATVVRP
jgi:hypothetical protein